MSYPDEPRIPSPLGRGVVNEGQLPEFLTFEEVAEIDKALLTAQDKFLTRITLYALRVLKQIAQAETAPVSAISDQQIAAWVEQDPALKQTITPDASFEQFFIRLVLSSLQPLRQISQETNTAIDDLNIAQVVTWFEQRAKQRLENQ
jgi:folate-binding Fe-S cluster repair protein YgfZ